MWATLGKKVKGRIILHELTGCMECRFDTILCDEFREQLGIGVHIKHMERQLGALGTQDGSVRRQPGLGVYV